MPNWAYSKVTISGDMKEVSRLKEQVSQPYQDPHYPDKTNEGVFLLWNIVKPNNLSAYLGEEKAKFDELIGADPELAELNKLVLPDNNSDLMARVIHDLATSDGWYEWNVRNWGTKWETGDKAVIEYELPIPLTNLDFETPAEMALEITYRMETAWSPPVEALAKLAEQYPDVTISLTSIDESDCFAMEAQWFRVPISPSEFVPQTYESDLDITHKLGMDLRGYCNLDCCNQYE
jgi:hypothetical protein